MPVGRGQRDGHWTKRALALGPVHGDLGRAPRHAVLKFSLALGSVWVVRTAGQLQPCSGTRSWDRSAGSSPRIEVARLGRAASAAPHASATRAAPLRSYGSVVRSVRVPRASEPPSLIVSTGLTGVQGNAKDVLSGISLRAGGDRVDMRPLEIAEAD